MEKDKNILVWILIAIIIVFLLVGSFGIGNYGMMGFGFLFMLLFFGLIIWLIVTLVNANQSSKKESEDSLTILKKRYASGEISKKQYEEMKKELLK
ncbi:SHOCT domain-containing protein [Candidatus Woesearchaeota archaeon]|nr:SHOCT domain-containing protein [Candidatus Woesearchaeota archaeon]